MSRASLVPSLAPKVEKFKNAYAPAPFVHTKVLPPSMTEKKDHLYSWVTSGTRKLYKSRVIHYGASPLSQLSNFKVGHGTETVRNCDLLSLVTTGVDHDNENINKRTDIVVLSDQVERRQCLGQLLHFVQNDLPSIRYDNKDKNNKNAAVMLALEDQGFAVEDNTALWLVDALEWCLHQDYLNDVKKGEYGKCARFMSQLGYILSAKSFDMREEEVTDEAGDISVAKVTDNLSQVVANYYGNKRSKAASAQESVVDQEDVEETEEGGAGGVDEEEYNRGDEWGSIAA